MKPSSWSLAVVLIFSLITGGVVGGIVVSYLSQLPQLEALEDYSPPVSAQVYSLDNQLIAEYYEQKRMVIPFEEIPKTLVQAFLAVEDANFYFHQGVDLKAIFRAFYSNLRAGKIVEGGSTITQQLAKVLFLKPERKMARKVNEAILAFQIDRTYSKDEILGLYLNQIYFGNGAYGVEAAAKTLFGKSAKNLTIAESAMLAGLPKSPNRYSPQHNHALALKRRNHVLRRMLEEGYLSPKEYQQALSSPLEVRPKRGKPSAPYFVEYIRHYLEETYGENLLYRGGLQVYTTLDQGMQKMAEQSLIEGLKKIDLRRKVSQEQKDENRAKIGKDQLTQGALLAIDPTNGFILAMVGGRDFEASQFNRATQAKRQPGSSIKPIIYAAAIEKGFTPADIIDDSPIMFPLEQGKTWQPENFDKQFHGPTTLRTGLEMSRNVVTIKLLGKIGVNSAIACARKMGLKSPLTPYLSLALGSSEVTLLELTSAYGVLANQGIRVDPVFIRRVVDRDGRVLQEYFHREERAISAQTAFILTSMLEGVIQRGTGSAARVLPYRLAGKTGTTDRFADTWFIGYAPELVVGVWVGLDNFQTLGYKETGGHTACPIWTEFMHEALRKRNQVSDFEVPDGLYFAFINPENGCLVDTNSPVKFLEVFKKGTEPSIQFNE